MQQYTTSNKPVSTVTHHEKSPEHLCPRLSRYCYQQQ